MRDRIRGKLFRLALDHPFYSKTTVAPARQVQSEVLPYLARGTVDLVDPALCIGALTYGWDMTGVE